MLNETVCLYLYSYQLSIIRSLQVALEYLYDDGIFNDPESDATSGTDEGSGSQSGSGNGTSTGSGDGSGSGSGSGSGTSGGEGGTDSGTTDQIASTNVTVHDRYYTFSKEDLF